VATGSAQVVAGATSSLCIGGLSSTPDTSTLSLSGGDPSKNELLDITITGQNASTSTLVCNEEGVTCTATVRRQEGSVTVRYDATNQPFTIKITTWTEASFLGILENIQAIRTELPEGNSQLTSGVNLVLFANK
jgi:hypothetical protein